MLTQITKQTTTKKEATKQRSSKKYQDKRTAEKTRTQVLELGPRDGSLLWSGLI